MDRQREVAGDELQFAVLDQALQAHAALAQGSQLLHVGVVDGEHAEVVVAGERAGDLAPPDVDGMAAIGQHHDVPRLVAGFAQACFIRQADVDPQLDLVGIGLAPQGRFVGVAEPLAELQPFVGIQREREQARHQSLLGFRRMPGEGQCVGGVVVPVHVADRQFGLVDGGGEGHGGT